MEQSFNNPAVRKRKRIYRTLPPVKVASFPKPQDNATQEFFKTNRSFTGKQPFVLNWGKS
jgi:hypothetical protein